jgi:hypothetical protein
MPEHDQPAVTAGRTGRGGRGGGRGGRRGGRSKAEQAIGMMYAASYLMNAPGTQQLLLWGGAEARDLVGHTVGLLADQQRLNHAADAWHDAGKDARHAAEELRGNLTALGWESSAADTFRAAHGARVDQLAALGEQYRATGDTLAAAAEHAGRVHQVLLAGTHASGEAVRLLATSRDGGPLGPAAAVTTGWLETGKALLAAWAEHADHAGATLSALRPASPARSVEPG